MDKIVTVIFEIGFNKEDQEVLLGNAYNLDAGRIVEGVIAAIEKVGKDYQVNFSCRNLRVISGCIDD